MQADSIHAEPEGEGILTEPAPGFDEWDALDQAMRADAALICPTKPGRTCLLRHLYHAKHAPNRKCVTCAQVKAYAKALLDAAQPKKPTFTHPAPKRNRAAKPKMQTEPDPKNPPKKRGRPKKLRPEMSQAM